jgi:hypothetical protein
VLWQGLAKVGTELESGKEGAGLQMGWAGFPGRDGLVSCSRWVCRKNQPNDHPNCHPTCRCLRQAWLKPHCVVNHVCCHPQVCVAVGGQDTPGSCGGGVWAPHTAPVCPEVWGAAATTTRPGSGCTGLLHRWDLLAGYMYASVYTHWHVLV